MTTTHKSGFAALIGDLLGWRILALMSTLRVPTEALVKSQTLLIYEDPIYYLHGLGFALLTGVSASLLAGASAPYDCQVGAQSPHAVLLVLAESAPQPHRLPSLSTARL